MTLIQPQDGAAFRGSIADLGKNGFRASCHAELDKKSSLLREQSTYQLCSTKVEARNWVHQQAAYRNFKKISWANEFSSTS